MSGIGGTAASAVAPTLGPLHPRLVASAVAPFRAVGPLHRSTGDGRTHAARPLLLAGGRRPIPGPLLPAAICGVTAPCHAPSRRLLPAEHRPRWNPLLVVAGSFAAPCLRRRLLVVAGAPFPGHAHQAHHVRVRAASRPAMTPGYAAPRRRLARALAAFRGRTALRQRPDVPDPTLCRARGRAVRLRRGDLCAAPHVRQPRRAPRRRRAAAR